MEETHVEESSFNADTIGLESLVVKHQIAGAVPGNGGYPFKELEDFLSTVRIR